MIKKTLRFLSRWGYRACVFVLILSNCLYFNTLWRYLSNYSIEGFGERNETRQVEHWEEPPRQGTERQKSWLMIGVPTVCRKNKNYVSPTLSSLVNHMHGVTGITIVVCICDTHNACRENIKINLTSQFFPHIESGLIQVIETPKHYYAPLMNLKQTFNDSETRVRWRSKQNLDYSFLMQHCANKSEYYLQLEDDVITVPRYIDKIKSYMLKIKQSWTMLDFSTLGFIGKLFKSKDLGKLATLLRTFYNEQPCDYLIYYYLKLMLQKDRHIRIPSLFQHRGHFSSLPNLVRNITESYSHFPSFKKRYHGDNPEATIFTSMFPWMSYKPSFAYFTSDNEMFWSTTPRIGDHYTVVFKTPQMIARIVVLTGKARDKADHLQGGILELGTTVKTVSGGKLACSNLSRIGKFVKGNIDIKVTKSVEPTKCLKVTITKQQDTWLIIREIAVFTKPK